MCATKQAWESRSVHEGWQELFNKHLKLSSTLIEIFYSMFVRELESRRLVSNQTGARVWTLVNYHWILCCFYLSLNWSHPLSEHSYNKILNSYLIRCLFNRTISMCLIIHCGELFLVLECARYLVSCLAKRDSFNASFSELHHFILFELELVLWF